jgi:hypothetical protein
MKKTKSLQAVFTKSSNKVWMIISGALLVLALIGMAVSVSRPVRVTQKDTLISYAQNSRFTYAIYLKPSYLYGPAPATQTVAEFPQAVVENIAFTYSFQPSEADVSGTTRVEAVLENPGIWQKALELIPATATSGNFTLDFSLDTQQINNIFTQIENGIDIPSSSRSVTIHAYFQSGSNVNVQSLPITIEDNLIKIPDTLSSTQDAGSGQFAYSINPVVPAIQTGDISYPSFNLSGRQSPATSGEPVILQPGQTDFINLIEKMNVNFVYQFQTDKPVENLKMSVDVVTGLAASQSWSKSFDLLQTEENGNFNLDFPVDIPGYTLLMQAINSETGATPPSYNLTVTINIHTTGQTAYGPIDETFSPALKGTIANNIITWAPVLTDSKTGVISQTTTSGNKYLGVSVPAARGILGIFSIAFLLLFSLKAVSYSRRRGIESSDFARETQKIQKRYGTRIAESVGNTLVSEKNPVSMNSIEDLMKIADELGKPVVHQSGGAPGETQSYYVIDGNTCYQYTLPVDKAEKDTSK